MKMPFRHAGTARGPAPADGPRLPSPGSAGGDLLAPGRIEIAHDHLRLDNTYTRTIGLTQIPGAITWGWLGKVVSLHEPMRIAIGVWPKDANDSVRELSHKLTQLDSSRLFAAEKGRQENPERRKAIEHHKAMIERLEGRDDKMFEVGVYAQTEGVDLAELDRRTERIEGAFGASSMLTRRAYFESALGLESTLPTINDPLAMHLERDGGTVATMYPFGAPTLFMETPESIWYGRNLDNNSPLAIDSFWRRDGQGFNNANSTVIGGSGSGKSTFEKTAILRGLACGHRYLIVDPGESAEYVALAAAVGGQVVRLSAGSYDHINPLDLPRPRDGASDDSGQEYEILREHIAGAGKLLDTLLAGDGARLGPTEKGRLESALFRCYRDAGITPDRSTHGRPAPILADLHRALIDMGDDFGLAERLDRYCNGAFAGLFSGRTTVRVDNALTVFDLRGLGDEDQRAATMHLVAQYVWGIILREESRLQFVVDEAHMVTKRRASGEFLEAVTKRARKHGAGVTALSQDPDDFLKTEAGRALVLNSSQTWIFRCEQLALEAIARGAALTAEEQRYLLSCPQGRGLLLSQHPYAKGQRMRLKVEIMVSPEFEPIVFTDATSARLAAQATPPTMAGGTPGTPAVAATARLARQARRHGLSTQQEEADHDAP